MGTFPIAGFAFASAVSCAVSETNQCKRVWGASYAICTLTAARAVAGFIPATGDEGIGQRRPPPLFIVPAARSAVKVKLPQAAVAACLVPQQVTGLRAQRVSPAPADFLLKCAKKY